MTEKREKRWKLKGVGVCEKEMCDGIIKLFITLLEIKK